HSAPEAGPTPSRRRSGAATRRPGRRRGTTSAGGMPGRRRPESRPPPSQRHRRCPGPCGTGPGTYAHRALRNRPVGSGTPPPLRSITDVEGRLSKEKTHADSTSLQVAVTSFGASERTGSRKGPLLYSRRARPDQDHSGAMPNVIAKPLTVAVVGATGLVGRTMTRALVERAFPYTELRLLASKRSAGTEIDVAGTVHTVREATPEAFDGVDIALFSAGGDTSTALAPEAAKRGATVIDNSSAWRMDPAVPLVVSQVNPDDLAWHEGIIANPNCSTMQLVPVLMDLRGGVGLERVVVDTYQAVSGTGGKATRELQDQVEAWVEQRPLTANVYPHQVAFNALPQVDVFLDNGYTKEEWKVVTESRKILHLPDLRISSTAVRIPVLVAHSEAAHVETGDAITPDRALTPSGSRYWWRPPILSTSRPSIRTRPNEPAFSLPPCPVSWSRTIRRHRRIRSPRRPPGATRGSWGAAARTPAS